MNEEKNIEVVKRAYELFKTGDVTALINLCGEAVEWKLPAIEGVEFSGERKGREEVVEFFRKVNECEEFSSFEPREFIAQNEKVVALGDYRCRVLSTNQEFESDFAHVFTLEKGEISSFKEFMDTAAVCNAYTAPLQHKVNLDRKSARIF